MSLLAHIGAVAATGMAYPLTSAEVAESNFGVALAAFTLDNDGTAIAQTFFGGSSGLGPWVVPTTAGIAAGHWCRVTGSGDTPAGSALNTWLQLNSDRSWQLAQSGAGSKSFAGTLQIATDAAGAHVVASIPFGLSVDAA